MKKKTDLNLEKITLDDDDNPIVWISKKLKNYEILKVGKIRCYDYPSLYEGIGKYIGRHTEEWGLKEDETVGYLIKGREGYNYTGYTYKTVVFYKIRDKLVA